MRNVEADQRWGVGAAADKGSRFANKNGWLSIDDSNGPGETDDGLLGRHQRRHRHACTASRC